MGDSVASGLCGEWAMGGVGSVANEFCGEGIYPRWAAQQPQNLQMRYL
jgi:hypothetical protein